MSVITKVEPINKDIEIIISETLSPAAQSAAFAQFARAQLKEGEEINRNILGRIPPHKTFVDGSEGRSEDDVRPGGVIVYEFELFWDVVRWIAIALEESSPVGGAGDPHPGLYKKSHTLFADGNEIPLGGDIPPAEEYVFMNMLPYSRKIERGSSRQFPDGVYQVIAQIARKKFGNVAKIFFTYRGVVGGQQINPMIGGATGLTRDKTTGRFIERGGSRAHNISDVRFPVIYVRPN